MNKKFINAWIILAISCSILSCNPINSVKEEPQNTSNAAGASAQPQQSSTIVQNTTAANEAASTDEKHIWTKVADLSVARAGISAVAFNGKIYAIGGESTAAEGLNIVEEYSPESDKWIIMESMPTKRSLAIAVAINDSIFVFGGVSTIRSLSIVEEYRPAENKWYSKANMPAPCGMLTSGVVVDGKVYILADNNVFLEYTPVTDTWVTKSQPDDINVVSRTLCAMGGKIYAFGGNKGVSTKNVDVYDTVADCWTRAADMPTDKYEIGVAAVAGNIYVLGGYNENKMMLCDVDMYDSMADKWIAKTPMPEYAHMPGVATLDGKVYILGGHDKLRRFQNLRKSVLVYNASLDN